MMVHAACHYQSLSQPGALTVSLSSKRQCPYSVTFLHSTSLVPSIQATVCQPKCCTSCPLCLLQLFLTLNLYEIPLTPSFGPRGYPSPSPFIHVSRYSSGHPLWQRSSSHAELCPSSPSRLLLIFYTPDHGSCIFSWRVFGTPGE